MVEDAHGALDNDNNSDNHNNNSMNDEMKKKKRERGLLIELSFLDIGQHPTMDLTQI